MHFNTIKSKISGVTAIKLNIMEDNRGKFQKLFNQSSYNNLFPEFHIKESYLTTSNANVIRGMHFQLPPFEHTKLVFCLSGKVTDVILDLRKFEAYGHFDHIELNSRGINGVYIPPGIAHGFFAHENNTKLLYMVDNEYSSDHDTGVIWDSFGFNWPSVNPIISSRDKGFIKFSEFSSPF